MNVTDVFKCTSDDMDVLHGALHKIREGTSKVSVPADTLQKLLFDHQDALKLLGRPIRK